MNRLAAPCILDTEQFRFPAENPTTGIPLREVWRMEGEQVVRVRMRDLKAGDVFYVRSQVPVDDPDHEDGCDAWLVADTDAWLHPAKLDWGITAHDYDGGELCNSSNETAG